jgi:hypothetical protein
MIYGNAVGSLIAGALHWPLWLVVPLLSYTVFTFGMTLRADAYHRAMGSVSPQITAEMFLPNIGLIVWNTAIQSAIFMAAWGVSLLFY